MVPTYGFTCCSKGYEATELSCLANSDHFKVLSCNSTVISLHYESFYKLHFSGPHPVSNLFYADANRALGNFLRSLYLGWSCRIVVMFLPVWELICTLTIPLGILQEGQFRRDRFGLSCLRCTGARLMDSLDGFLVSMYLNYTIRLFGCKF